MIELGRNYYLIDLVKSENIISIDLYQVEFVFNNDDILSGGPIISEHWEIKCIMNKDLKNHQIGKGLDINSKLTKPITSFYEVGPKLFNKLRKLYTEILISYTKYNNSDNFIDGVLNLVKYLKLIGIESKIK